MSQTAESVLYDFQLKAVEAWERGDSRGPHRGTLEIFTGGGKTLIALAAFERARRSVPDLKLAVVVPTEALARQWVDAIAEHTDIPREEIGLLGAGGHDDLGDNRVLVAVINSAAKELPDMARRTKADLMLVVDESHRAGAPTFSRVLSTQAAYRLGLSATPDREDVDDDGEPIEYDEHRLGRDLGEVVFNFGLDRATRGGWLPPFDVHHHGVGLLEEERRRYDALTREIDDLADRLRGHGLLVSQARRSSGRDDDAGRTARAYVGATARRKDLLYRARERERVVTRLIHRLVERREGPHVLLFHERVDQAESLFSAIKTSNPGAKVALEHSGLPQEARARALEGFRNGSVDVLVSVRSLIEGIDVPGADVGISVASTSSVRQRIQALGRVLRRATDVDGGEKEAEMHILYVRNSADESIYAKEDWSDLTGPERNHYWRWPLDPNLPPEREAGPPRKPKPTEEQEWERLAQRTPTEPVEWLGALPEREYSVDTRGNVTTFAGSLVSNPQQAGEMVSSVRDRPGGRFWVTPSHHLVLARGDGERRDKVWVIGQLEEPFGLRSTDRGSEVEVDSEKLEPGAPYPGSTDKKRGSYHLRQKGGGVIERRKGSSREFALMEDAEAPERGSNARNVLEAWRKVSHAGMPFFLNDRWDAWYLEEGEPRFLARVPGGFEWPATRERQ